MNSIHFTSRQVGMSHSKILLAKAKESLKCFELSSTALRKMKASFEVAMERGLNDDMSSLKMLRTFVRRLPTGSEVGSFLALDLGGTNYRILLVTLTPNKAPKIEEKSFMIPQDIMTGTGDQLFSYIARSLVEFLRSYDALKAEIDLGFTFSFPCIQLALDKAKLIRWTKGFNVSDVEDRDVSELLQAAIEKENLLVKCVAVINDTVGTLASCALEDPYSSIGLIVGTGVNAAYVESCPIGDDGEAKHMVINTECGAFGDKGEIEHIRTDYDRQIDTDSIRQGCQTFEKMISGMYLGEIVRRVIVDFTERGILFNGSLPKGIDKVDGFSTKFITEIERDPVGIHYGSQSVMMTHFGIGQPVDSDLRIIRLICEAVTRRAAFLVGTVIASIVQRMKRRRVTVGIDGSVFRYHTRFGENMIRQFHCFNTSNALLRVMLSTDGSGKGAAAIAAANSYSSPTPISDAVAGNDNHVGNGHEAENGVDSTDAA